MPRQLRIENPGAAHIPQTGFEVPGKQVELNRTKLSLYKCAGLTPLRQRCSDIVTRPISRANLRNFGAIRRLRNNFQGNDQQTVAFWSEMSRFGLTISFSSIDDTGSIGMSKR